MRSPSLAAGGPSEQFRSPGGWLANHDLLDRVPLFHCVPLLNRAHERAHERADVDPAMLLGEATFLQFHGGVSTNTPPRQHP